ncbi:MAG: T9SS type A sorting domain-containing protein [Bacteroidales bacterium]|nr:T9SS type A sorting domain-containing protein [Bacteroidales bacterium]
MKKSLLILASLLMLVSVRLNAQNDRILLFECFTNTSCGPCASQNPALDALINSNADRVAAIKYHMSWPGSNDPMYLHNTTDNNARRSVYNVNSVPHTVVDGIRFGSVPSGLSQNMVNNWLAIESPYEMRLGYEVDEAANTVTVHVMGRASTDISGSLKLYVGVIEREIHYNSAPGTNGERDFYSVMKKLLPTATGTSLGNVSAGDYFAYTFTWEMANVYNNDQIDAIAWIQNPESKEVIQACKSSQNMVPFYSNEAAVSNITNVKSMNCSGLLNPMVELSNNGSLPVTSAELEVVVNGEVVKNVEWNGNLPCYGTTVVDLGEINVQVREGNTLEVQIVRVNGNTDEGLSNNNTNITFLGSPENVGVTVKLQLRTDNNPQETTWKLTNLDTGEVVQEGGPYDEAAHTYNVTFVIPVDGCYDFTIYDTGGDGLSNTGLYGVKAGNKTLFSGGIFAYSESNEFSYGQYAGAEELSESSTCVFPNPTSGMVTIVCEGEQPVAVFNLAGQCVYQGVASGWLKVDLSGFGAGVYAVKVGDKVWRTVVK